MKRFLAGGLASGFLLMTLTVMPSLSFAQSKQVQAVIPEFPVQVNGTVVDNSHARYPLLLYNNITYFPLTWDMAQALQWQVNWSEADGLQVFPAHTIRGGGAFGYSKSPLQQDLSASNRLGVPNKAQLPDFPVTINNERIDNANEPYPLLVFRDITYFPLTWRFAHDLLGLDLNWNPSDGLEVRSPQQPVLNRIMFDDAEHLYFTPALQTKPDYTLLKVNKSLDETPVWITNEEAKAVNPDLDLLSYRKPSAGTDVTSSLLIEGDQVYYKSIKLDLDPDSASQGDYKREVSRSAQWFPIGDQEGLLSVVTTDKIIGVPLRTPPYRAELFHVKGDHATKLPGFKDIPQGVIANPDGSHWIYANLDRMGDIRNYYYRSAQLAQLGPDGSYHLINDEISAEFINVLGTDNLAADNPARPDGTLTIEVFQKNPDVGLYAKPGGTLYTLSTNRQVTALHQFDKGIPFMDRNQRIFIYNPDQNAVTSLSDNKVKFWWDYELISP